MKQKKTKKERLSVSPEHQHFLTEFGKTVREVRKVRKWSQSKLAAKVGSNTSYISDVELGKCPLCTEKMSQLMKELGFTCTLSISLCDKWVDDDSVL